ncbi:ATP/GTP-binding protein [Streptomyces sp. NPDC051561]|uniref:ATP/GTP-binding protein n=1 Tax=Streptomyces sp. NPDC051561 TaxID=3365658 RepID=UPI003789C3CF
MAGRDLRALFGSNDRNFTAGEAFTNRQGQWQLVAAALTEHLHDLAQPGFRVDDFEAPRRNVLTFHGVGGIGKTVLSRKLEATLKDAADRPAQWGEPVWPAGWQILPVRIDLARSAGTDFERVILTIRLALAELGHPLPAFDIALRRYWERQHPGEPLEEYLRRSTLASKVGKNLPQQMQSAMSDVAQALLLPGTVGTVVGQVTGSLVGALRERRQSVRALAGCARLADLLEAEADLDALSYYPHLLAFELSQLPADKRVLPVVLLDTFEDVGDRTHRDLERLLQRLVWLMPNAFFVITGRSRLQWADPALEGQLDWTGPVAWPGLAAHDIPLPRPATGTSRGRQVLVGDFSSEDCEDYLAHRLTTSAGQPLLPAALREQIAARSHGLPLYLDLAVMRVLEIRRTGRIPVPADFDGGFPALISRTLQDLTPQERHVLRAASLFDAFDTTLAVSAAALLHESAARRLIERPFVRDNPFGLWPYYLHALIRTTLRTADDATDDAWTAADWAQAADRALTALGTQWQQHTRPGRRLLIGCLRQGLILARDFRLALGWLADAAWMYVGDSVWEPLAPPAPHPASPVQLETAADALVELLSALARRQHQHRSHTAARLTTVIDSHLLPDDLQHMALYYRAKAHRDLGDSPASRTGMQTVADGQGRLAPAARRGLAHLARMAGDFPTALTTARTLGWEGRHHRVQGDIWWLHADMDRAAVAYAAARDEADTHGVTGERGNSQAHRAFALAFTDPSVADSELALAEQLLAGVDLRVTTLITHIAALARDAGRTDTDIDDRGQALRAEITAAGVTYAELALDLALAFHHAVQGDQDQVTATIARLRENTRDGDFAYYSDIAAFMAALPLDEASPARWIDGAQHTRRRWRSLVTTRHNTLQNAL